MSIKKRNRKKGGQSQLDSASAILTSFEPVILKLVNIGTASSLIHTGMHGLSSRVSDSEGGVPWFEFLTGSQGKLLLRLLCYAFPPE
jgi:hypothetical protein